MRILFFIFIFFTSFTTSVFAGDWENAQEAYEAGDYQTAFALIEPLAKESHIEAQIYLSVMYAEGLGTKSDKESSLNWMMKAAEQGNAGAQMMVGASYFSGRGTKKNFAKAHEWFGKAAEQGFALAQSRYGNDFLYGYGTKKNIEKGIHWYELAAKQNDSHSAYILGNLYGAQALGNYIGPRNDHQDYVKSLMWFKIYNLISENSANRNIKRLEKTMPPEEIKKANQLVESWKAEHQ